MSAVTLLCADRPLPLYESGVRRVETSSYGGYTVRIEASGFSVGEHTYYREAVEDLYLTMKPCRYQLDLRATQEDAAELRAYLAKHLRPGETVELWNLWVGTDPARPRRFSGALGDVKSAGGYLRRELGRALSLRYTPELQFVEDDSIDTGAHILSMLRNPEVVKPANPANAHIELDGEE